MCNSQERAGTSSLWPVMYILQAEVWNRVVGHMVTGLNPCMLIAGLFPARCRILYRVSEQKPDVNIHAVDYIKSGLYSYRPSQKHVG